MTHFVETQFIGVNLMQVDGTYVEIGNIFMSLERKIIIIV